MIKRLYEQLLTALSTQHSEEQSDEERAKALRLATAVLLVDVARADDNFSEAEFERVITLITRHFSLSTEEAAQLVNSADEQAEQLASVYELTRELHVSLDDDEKAEVVRLLWEVAYADGELDKFEDSLVLKISDLLYVSRGLVMRLKHDAQTRARA
ncbi:MAG TPA: TerB family tellurite resistance protein [Woeseiaceae bacterium]|nr:TerB family tellurite resistance protein [Woeseiaceae bacterium]